MNYLNSFNQNSSSHWWILLLNFSVLTCESDSCILQFLNKLNLTYKKWTSFVASIYFIPIVLVLWGRFPLCHTPIRPISAFHDHISILIMGCITTWSRGSHQLVSRGFLCYFCFFSVPLSFSVFASIFLFFVSTSSKKKQEGLYFILLLSLIISVVYIYIYKKKKREIRWNLKYDSIFPQKHNS
jgi:uncharacterized membrane protein